MGKRNLKKYNEKEEKGDITKEILLGILKTGAVLGLAIFAPGVLKVFKNYAYDNQWEEFYPSSIEKVARRLYRRGFVKVEYESGSPVVTITDKGRVEVLKYDLNRLDIKPMKNWDKRWRIVIFDISEKYRNVRNLVRDKLREIGFYKMQESVFIFPYPCEKEIKYLREVLEVPHSIKLIRADRIENDSDLRKIFQLPLD